MLRRILGGQWAMPTWQLQFALFLLSYLFWQRKHDTSGELYIFFLDFFTTPSGLIFNCSLFGCKLLFTFRFCTFIADVHLVEARKGKLLNECEYFPIRWPWFLDSFFLSLSRVGVARVCECGLKSKTNTKDSKNVKTMKPLRPCYLFGQKTQRKQRASTWNIFPALITVASFYPMVVNIF